jgi:hypothetical protein
MSHPNSLGFLWEGIAEIYSKWEMRRDTKSYIENGVSHLNIRSRILVGID